METKYQELLKELHRAFDFFNEKFAEGKLERPVITVSSAAGKNALGWFGAKFWKDGEEEVNEINMSAEYFNRSVEDVLETLLHEMAHLKNAQNGVDDCSASQYHNKSFKVAAESFSLEVKKSKYRGFSSTNLTDVSREVINQLNPDEKVYSFYRRTFRTKRIKKYIPLMIKYTDDNEELIDKIMSKYSGSKVEMVEDALSRLLLKLDKKGDDK